MINPIDPAARDNTTSDIARLVLDHVRKGLPRDIGDGLTMTTPLRDLGFDSLTLMETINRIEEQFGMRFREEWLYDIETCQDIAELIVAHRTRTNPTLASAAHLMAAHPPCAAQSTSDSQVASGAAADPAQFPECVALEERLAEGAALGLVNPFFRKNQEVRPPFATMDGRTVLRYTSYDYLDLTSHPEITRAAIEAIGRFGTSASASRLVGGEHDLLEEMEQALAQFLRAEAAVVFPSGYGTNASLFGHLFGSNDLILYDELAHNSITQGVQLSGAKHRSFRHNDHEALERLLGDIRGQYRRAVVAVEGVYSMDGDYPDLPRLMEIKRRHNALLYVDEAHSLGTLGATGRGICEHFGVDPAEGDLWMGTLSKTLASFGGYLAGPARLIRYLKYTTPGLIFSAAPPPGNLAASVAALGVLRREPQRVERLRQNAALFLRLAQQAGLNTGPSRDTPVIPIILGNSIRCIRVSNELLQRGIDARPILYPAVRESAARLRFFITAAHTPEQIEHSIAMLQASLAATSPP